MVAWTLSPAGGTVLSFSFTILVVPLARDVVRALGACCAFHAARFRSLFRLCSSLESVEGPPKSKVIPPVAGAGAGVGSGAGPPKSKVLPPTGAGGTGGAGFATVGFTVGLDFTGGLDLAYGPACTLGVGSVELPGRPLEGGMSAIAKSSGPFGGGGGGRALVAARLMRAASGGGGGGGG